MTEAVELPMTPPRLLSPWRMPQCSDILSQVLKVGGRLHQTSDRVRYILPGHYVIHRVMNVPPPESPQCSLVAHELVKQTRSQLQIDVANWIQPKLRLQFSGIRFSNILRIYSSG